MQFDVLMSSMNHITFMFTRFTLDLCYYYNCRPYLDLVLGALGFMFCPTSVDTRVDALAPMPIPPFVLYEERDFIESL